jgi:hypothetical protein
MVAPTVIESGAGPAFAIFNLGYNLEILNGFALLNVSSPLIHRQKK